MRSEFEKAFKNQYPHADYLACLKFDDSTNGYSLKKEVDKPDVNFWVCVGVNASWWAWQHQQSKVDELQKQRDSFIKAYEIEIDKSDELQKRVDAVKQLIEEYRDPPTEDKTFQHALSIVADELEQALKGGSDE